MSVHSLKCCSMETINEFSICTFCFICELTYIQWNVQILSIPLTRSSQCRNLCNPTLAGPRESHLWEVRWPPSSHPSSCQPLYWWCSAMDSSMCFRTLDSQPQHRVMQTWLPAQGSSSKASRLCVSAGHCVHWTVLLDAGSVGIHSCWHERDILLTRVFCGHISISAREVPWGRTAGL